MSPIIQYCQCVTIIGYLTRISIKFKAWSDVFTSYIISFVSKRKTDIVGRCGYIMDRLRSEGWYNLLLNLLGSIPKAFQGVRVNTCWPSPPSKHSSHLFVNHHIIILCLACRFNLNLFTERTSVAARFVDIFYLGQNHQVWPDASLACPHLIRICRLLWWFGGFYPEEEKEEATTMHACLPCYV